jgi:site-specific DNA recombinase
VRTVGYIRVSTEEQREEGYSLAAQRRQIQAFCQAKRWELVRVFSDEGKSGKEVRGRSGLQALLEAAKAHEFEAVVVCKLDRLGRNTRQLLGLVDDYFTKNGVKLVSIQEGIDPTTATGEFTLTILAGLSQMERKQIGERTRQGMTEAKRQGKHVGRVGYGWRMGEGGELVPVAAEQRQLARAKRLAKKHGYTEAARRMGWNMHTLYYRVERRKRRGKRLASG